MRTADLSFCFESFRFFVEGFSAVFARFLQRFRRGFQLLFPIPKFKFQPQIERDREGERAPARARKEVIEMKVKVNSP